MEKNFTTLGPYVLPVSEQVRTRDDESWHLHTYTYRERKIYWETDVEEEKGRETERDRKWMGHTQRHTDRDCRGKEMDRSHGKRINDMWCCPIFVTILTFTFLLPLSSLSASQIKTGFSMLVRYLAKVRLKECIHSILFVCSPNNSFSFCIPDLKIDVSLLQLPISISYILYHVTFSVELWLSLKISSLLSLPPFVLTLSLSTPLSHSLSSFL